jgi:phospholipid/cholesterol/gamma-HCH transport system substrate-binding protein
LDTELLFSALALMFPPLRGNVLMTKLPLMPSIETLSKSTYRVKAEFQNVSGLSDGADVRVGGIHEGTVRRIDLPKHPDGKVTVVMDLERATRAIVKEDSLAAIKSEGLLGDKYIEVSFGSDEAKQLQDGETIESEPPLDISDLLSKTNQILDTTKTAMEGAVETVNNLQSITSKIDRGKGSVGALINNKAVYTQATEAATNLAESMEALKHNFLMRGSSRIEDMRIRATLRSIRSPSSPWGLVRRPLATRKCRFSTSPTQPSSKTRKS